jgi:hypothetical protein
LAHSTELEELAIDSGYADMLRLLIHLRKYTSDISVWNDTSFSHKEMMVLRHRQPMNHVPARKYFFSRLVTRDAEEKYFSVP